MDTASKIVCLDGVLSNCTLSFFVRITAKVTDIFLVKSNYIIS